MLDNLIFLHKATFSTEYPDSISLFEGKFYLCEWGFWNYDGDGFWDYGSTTEITQEKAFELLKQAKKGEYKVPQYC